MEACYRKKTNIIYNGFAISQATKILGNLSHLSSPLDLLATRVDHPLRRWRPVVATAGELGCRFIHLGFGFIGAPGLEGARGGGSLAV